MTRPLRGWLTRLAAAVGLVLATAPAVAGAAPPPDDVRRKTAEVFDRPEFRTQDPAEARRLLQPLIDFFRWLGGLYENSPPLFWLLLIVCLVALALMLLLIGYQIRMVFAVGARRRGDEAGQEAERVRRSAAYRAEADRRAAAGDYTEAVRFLFLSLVYRFDERGRVSFHKDYTNREYLDLLDRAAVRDALRVLVDVLDDHWYGQRPCGRPQYEECRRVYDRLAA